MDAAVCGGDATPDASAYGGKLETLDEEMRLGFFRGHDANMAGFGDEVAAAAPCPFRAGVALLYAEGAALIGNPVDHDSVFPVGEV